MPELYPWQEEALSKLHDGAILLGDVGSGKSMTALAYYAGKHLPKDLYIITTAKKRNSLEWNGEMAGYGLYPSGDDSRAKVVVDSWNNIKKYSDVKDAFFILDEQKLIGKGAWVKAFLKIAKSNKWILLTATPADTWIDFVPVFLANGFYKNRTEFMMSHVQQKTTMQGYPIITGFFGVKKLERLRDQVVVQMPYSRHTVRNRVALFCNYPKELVKILSQSRWNIFEDKPVETSSEYMFAYKRLLWSDPSRLDRLEDVMTKHPKLIVFYNFDFELDLIRRRLTDIGATFSEYNGHKHEDIPDGDNWVYLVNYKSGAEAWNCTDTDAMLFYSQTYSYREREQCEGRIDRLNTPYTQLYYYTFMTHTAFEGVVKRTVDEKKEFNENTWAKSVQTTKEK